MNIRYPIYEGVYRILTLISSIGSSSVEMCTGPPFSRGGNLTVGSGTWYFLLAGIGIGICTGAVGGLEMIA